MASGLDSGRPSDRPQGGILSRLRREGLAPRRALGQNFLCDPAILGAIADQAELGPQDAVLEIGTGPGTLTRFLCQRAGRVVSVEIDGAMAAFARRELAQWSNLEIVHGDALGRSGRLADAVVERIRSWPAWKLVANLPYAAATTIVVECFSTWPALSRGVVTVQKEVADRLSARPGCRDYGPVTLLLGYWAEVRPWRELPPGAFTPPPKVSSTIIDIARRAAPLGAPREYPAFAYWVRRLFGQRRKQIGGILRRELGEERAAQAIEWCRMSPSARAEDLPAELYLALARHAPGAGGEGECREASS